eukprot:ctg_1892.g709
MAGRRATKMGMEFRGARGRDPLTPHHKIKGGRGRRAGGGHGYRGWCIVAGLLFGAGGAEAASRTGSELGGVERAAGRPFWRCVHAIGLARGGAAAAGVTDDDTVVLLFGGFAVAGVGVFGGGRGVLGGVLGVPDGGAADDAMRRADRGLHDDMAVDESLAGGGRHRCGIGGGVCGHGAVAVAADGHRPVGRPAAVRHGVCVLQRAHLRQQRDGAGGFGACAQSDASGERDVQLAAGVGARTTAAHQADLSATGRQ